MSTKPVKKPSLKGAIGLHVNTHQQIISEIEHPEIETKRKAAFAKSPPIRDGDAQVYKGMRDTIVQFKKGADIEDSMRNFEKNVSRAHTGGNHNYKPIN